MSTLIILISCKSGKMNLSKSKICRRRHRQRPLGAGPTRKLRGALTLTLCASDLSPAEQWHTWLAGWASFCFLLAIKFFQSFQFFYKCFVLIFQYSDPIFEAFDVFFLLTAAFSRCFAVF